MCGWLVLICDVCVWWIGGEGESPRIPEVIVFATTLECDGDSVIVI